MIPIVRPMVGIICCACFVEAQSRPVRIEPIYALQAGEGVFAYARISPDGKFLVYASEGLDPIARKIKQTIKVVDLGSRKVLFSESGIDAYWSNDGKRMIYLSMRDSTNRVSIRHNDTGIIQRDVAPANLGDYYSWGMRDGKDLILTIAGNYYFLEGDTAMLPIRHVPSCRGIGTGERPLLSKDGKLISAFVREKIVIRSLTDCANIFDTGVQGAKADFSWDGRYIAFHAPKKDLSGYQIEVVDLEARTIRVVTNLSGSSLFPSWTKDGRLCFRYDGDDYHGFMVADGVLAAPARRLSGHPAKGDVALSWHDVFPETSLPTSRINIVVIWSSWSAHAPIALGEFQRAQQYFAERTKDVGFFTATEIGSSPVDLEHLRQRHSITLRQIPLGAERLGLTGAINQIPATLLFRDGRLEGQRLGALSFEDVRAWIGKLPRQADH